MPQLADLLARFEARTDDFREIEVSTALRALPEDPSTEERQYIRWEMTAFHFLEDYPDNGTGWGTYFGPMVVLPGKDGGSVEVPSLAEITAEVLAYWLLRAREAKHPILRMRYADLVWDLAPRVPSAKREIDSARIAVDAALELAARPETRHMTGRTKLTRALSIARSIKDRDREGRVRDAMIAFEERTAEDELAGTWGYSFDELVEAKGDLEPGQEKRILDALESRLKRLSGEDGTAGGDPYAVQGLALRLARYYQRAKDKENMRRVLRASADVFERLARQAMPLVGAQWMRDVYEMYREFDLSAEADALNPILAELGARAKQNLRRVTHEVEVPKEHFERLGKAVLKTTVEESLAQIVGIFLVNPDHAEEEVKRLAREFPLQGMMRMVRIDDRGKVESDVGGVQSDLRGRVIVQMGQTISLASLSLRHALDVVFKRFSVQADGLATIICLSPAFGPEQQPFLQRAMRAYFDEDWLACIHVLIPQIENAVRAVVIKLGGTHLRPHRLGGFVYRPLDDLLRDPKLGGLVGASVVQYLQVVLTDQRGLNLRNGVCHGYLPAEQLGREVADRLLHVALVFGLVREDEGPPPPQEK